MVKSWFTKCLSVCLIALYVFLLFYLKPWADILKVNDLPDLLLSFTSTATLLGLIVCCVGMIRGAGFARKMFLIGNGVYLVFGCYATYIYWTLWIFKTPTFFERVQAATGPFLLGVVIPAVLFFYFLHPRFGMRGRSVYHP